MKDIVVYKNRTETRLLLIAVGIILGLLYATVTIVDISTQNPVFWNNQKTLLLLVLVCALPILIILRFRITFNYTDRTITYTGYFSSKTQYSFDEVKVTTVRKGRIPIVYFVFATSQKKIFQISEKDFEAQAYESVSRLKELFTGEEKFVYDIERKVNEKEYIFDVYNYAFSELIGIVHGGITGSWLSVGYNPVSKEFSVQAWTNVTTEGFVHEEILVEEATVAADYLEANILEMASHYLRPVER